MLAGLLFSCLGVDKCGGTDNGQCWSPSCPEGAFQDRPIYPLPSRPPHLNQPECLRTAPTRVSDISAPGACRLPPAGRPSVERYNRYRSANSKTGSTN
ncbi:hypothetical protein J6590_013301 [Homalodisca vitripennis]|nr:hypothetical protein J6590_013301 [Homalodisca vitripennis]